MQRAVHGGLRGPVQADGGPGAVGAVGQQRQVPRDQNLLAQLAVQGQLGVETVPLQVEDEDSERKRRVSWFCSAPSLGRVRQRYIPLDRTVTLAAAASAISRCG